MYSEIPAAEFNGRFDFREREQITFAIAMTPSETTSIERAFTVKSNSAQCTIAVHIADVSYWVRKGSSVDLQARERSTSYSLEDLRKIPMLPENISSDICSLLPGQNRLTLSCVFTVDYCGNVENVEIKKGIIQSQCSLDYKEAEELLAVYYSDDGSQPRYEDPLTVNLTWALDVLNQISIGFAINRLSRDNVDCNPPSLNAPNLQMIPEEFMIATNHYMIEYLFYIYPIFAPLRQEIPYYTSSPMIDYFDLIVQRLILSSFDGGALPHTPDEIVKLCVPCSDVERSGSRKSKNAVSLSHLCDFIKQKSVVAYPVVDKIDDSSLRLCFPLIQSLIPTKVEIKSSHLNLSTKPKIRDSQITLNWSQRIYNTMKYHLGESDGSSSVSLNSAGSMPLSLADQYLVDGCLSSEGQALLTSNHLCEYNTVYEPGSVIKVQLSTEMNHGLLVPAVQLIVIAEDTHVCVEHNKNPMKCFTTITSQSATRNWYDNIKAYQNLWMPVLKMISASSAAKNELSAVVHNIKIRWQQCYIAEGTTCKGTFQIPVKFCRERFIHILENGHASTGDEDSTLAYICVRYANLQVPTPNCSVSLDHMLDVKQSITWVGHCVAVRATIDDCKEMYTVHLQLNQSSIAIPNQLLQQKSASDLPATIEWIGVPKPNRLMDNAIHGLKEGTILAQRIALGGDFPRHDAEYSSLIQPWIKMIIPGHKPLNFLQSSAVRHALTNTFALIQGPPGTGKTVVSTNLAYLFAQINKNVPSENEEKIKAQVMCCGPSNKSVDVLAGYLSTLNAQNLRVLRIYSKCVVLEEFPIPGKVSSIKKTAKLTTSNVPLTARRLSLHHLIRSEISNPSSAKDICKYDELIRNSKTMSQVEREDYLTLISDATATIVRSADIILLTTAVSASRAVRLNVNIQQLIIDECGMCTEPESFVPIVASRAKHIVLVGDDKQLRPIIEDKTAEKLGLGRSLFARYAKKAFMLKTQYRMHQTISALPSREFYDDNLTIGTKDQTKSSDLHFWPAGSHTPIAFAHHVSPESALGASLYEGNEQSKSNLQEVDYLVSIVTAMVSKYPIESRHIAVLTQYRAQCNEISRRLIKINLPDITVQTITTAQGSEWEYVILSTVRSLPELAIRQHKPNSAWTHRNLGFIVDKHQVNVALTRARKGLIILGNEFLLSTDRMWSRILRHYQVRGVVVNAADLISAINRDQMCGPSLPSTLNL